MTKVLVVHGAGMDLRGKVNVDIFGPMTLGQYDERIAEFASALSVTVETFQSNVEEEVIARLRQARDDGVDFVLINPAGYSTGHRALAKAVGQLEIPAIELHVSNPASRGGSSEIAPVCRGTITGFGIFGYYLGLRGALSLTGGGD